MKGTALQEVIQRFHLPLHKGYPVISIMRNVTLYRQVQPITRAMVNTLDNRPTLVRAPETGDHEFAEPSVAASAMILSGGDSGPRSSVDANRDRVALWHWRHPACRPAPP